MLKSFKYRLALGLSLVLSLTTVVTFPTLLNGWTEWDDKYYVLDNPLVKNLTWEKVALIFQQWEMNGSYSPLPAISWGINFLLAGLEAFPYHTTNLALHIINTSLVFWFIRSLKQGLFVSLATALLFGIHPLHLEPVAWITGRKDLMYSMFMLGSLIAWMKYLRTDNIQWKYYLLALLLFILSLFSKGVAVVLPIIFLLLDYFLSRSLTVNRVLEKLPFFGLSLVFGLVAIYAQQESSAMESLTDISYLTSIGYASYGLTLYIIQVIAPFQIGAFHAYPAQTEMLSYILGTSFILCNVIALTLLFFRRNRTVVFGFGFFIIALLPVLQVIPVGTAMMADRYTYISYIGLFFLLSLFTKYMYTRFSIKTPTLAKGMLVFGFAYILWLGHSTYTHAEIWKSSYSLWTNVIEQHPHSSKGYINRGRYYAEKNQLVNARKDLDKALELSPDLPVVYQERGLLFQRMNEYQFAEESFSTALSLNPLYTPALLNRAVNHIHIGQLDDALVDLNNLKTITPKNILIYLNEGVIYEQQNQFDKSIEAYSKAIEFHPMDYRGFQYRGVCNFRMERYNDAREDVTNWIKLSPDNGKAVLWRSRLVFLNGQFENARSDAARAEEMGTSVKPEYLQMIRDSLEVGSQGSSN